MADNVTLPGTGIVVVADEITSPYTGGTAEAQGMKIIDGVANGTVPAGVDANGKLKVISAEPLKISQTPTVTAVTTAYVANDQVGGLLTFAGAGLATGGGGYIEKAQLFCDDTATPAQMTLWLFNDTPTSAGDNAAFTLSDADAHKLIDVFAFGPAFNSGANSVGMWKGRSVYDLVGTTVYGLLRVEAAQAVFSATSAIIVVLHVLPIS